MKEFRGSRVEMLLIKRILSKAPGLEEVVIIESYYYRGPPALKITKEMIRFPRAYPKAQIIFLETK
ncbi:unnamed protein product [Cuscuta europaea]|uniref:Uncharacterized protein n=1 Tax=Cuscuta europaea TaxID=41803 RepID=A0A9P1EFV0_CUSEU|nr:unnamed protein product [Cuscuta europaea]